MGLRFFTSKAAVTPTPCGVGKVASHMRTGPGGPGASAVAAVTVNVRWEPGVSASHSPGAEPETQAGLS